MKTLKDFALHTEARDLTHLIKEQQTLLTKNGWLQQIDERGIILTDSLKQVLLSLKHHSIPNQIFFQNDAQQLSLVEWNTILFTQKAVLNNLLVIFFKDDELTKAIRELDIFYAKIFESLFTQFENKTTSEYQKYIESDEKYRDLFDNAHDMIHILEPSGKIMYVNQSWINNLGYSVDELKGSNIYSIVHERDKEKFKNYRESLLAGKPISKDIQISLKKKDEEYIIVEGFVSVKDEGGSGIYTRGIFRDITSRVQNEKELLFYTDELKEREENLNQLIQHAPDAIIVVDENGFIQLWNKKAEEIFGWTSNEAMGESLADTIVPEVYKKAHSAGMKRYLSTGDAHVLNKTIEITALRKSGEEFYITLTISEFIRTGKKFFISFIKDISQQKQNEKELQRKKKELEQSNEELEQYSWLASHDLKEPLRKILTYTDIVLSRHQNSLTEEVNGMMQKVHSSARRMGNLIQAMLMYSSVSSEEELYVISSLNSIINEVLVDLELAIHENNAVVQVDELPEVEIIPFQMRQLFQNLISNSIKYSKKDVPPIIKISSQTIDANTIAIQVEDNGIGFGVKDEAKIFQLFQRLHTEQKKEGTGIGLALCKKIAQNHGGNISVKSEPGQGSTFTITLPVKH